jgi:hypothetical protein
MYFTNRIQLPAGVPIPDRLVPLVQQRDDRLEEWLRAELELARVEAQDGAPGRLDVSIADKVRRNAEEAFWVADQVLVREAILVGE